MAFLVHGLQAERVRANYEQVRAEIATAATAAGRDPASVEVVAACKYVPLQELPALVEAGLAHLGENRAQELVRKASAFAPGGDGVALDGGRGRGDGAGPGAGPGAAAAPFTWDFIGALQSKHVRAIVPHVRLIHSLASESALRELARVADRARAGLRVLVEVNVAGDPSKGGVRAQELPRYIARSPFPVAGLMTMPPLAADPEQSRPHFRALRELAERHGLEQLSMGTSQDFAVAVQEGATIVRIGTRLYASAGGSA